MNNPMASNFRLSTKLAPDTDVESEYMASVYATVVGCLMHAMVCTIPDLTHVIAW